MIFLYILLFFVINAVSEVILTSNTSSINPSINTIPNTIVVFKGNISSIYGYCDPMKLDNCNNKGVCIDLEKNSFYVCMCDDRYLGYNCEIKQKSRLTAFLLELFFGFYFGGGDFYLGRILLGVIKIFLTILIAVFIFYFYGSKGIYKNVFFTLLLLLHTTLLIWWILDLIYIARGYYNDGNGNQLFNDFD